MKNKINQLPLVILLLMFSAEAFSFDVNEPSCLATYILIPAIDGTMSSDQARSINKLSAYKPEAKIIYTRRIADWRARRVSESDLESHANQCNEALGLDYSR